MKSKFLLIMILSLITISIVYYSVEARMDTKESICLNSYYQPSTTPQAPQPTDIIIEPPTQEEYNLIRIMTGLVFLSVTIVLVALWVNRSHISL